MGSKQLLDHERKRGQGSTVNNKRSQGSAVNKEAQSTLQSKSWNGSAFNLTIKHETKMRQAQWTQIYERRMSERPGKNKLLDIHRQYYKKRTCIQEHLRPKETLRLAEQSVWTFEEKNDHMNSFYDWSTHDDDRILSIYIQRLEWPIQEINAMMKRTPQLRITKGRHWAW